MSSIFDLNDDEEAPAKPAVSVPENRPAPAAPAAAPKRGGTIFDLNDDEGDAPVATPASPPKEDWWEEWKRRQNEAGTPKVEAPTPEPPKPLQPVPPTPTDATVPPPLTGPQSDKLKPESEKTWAERQNEAGGTVESGKTLLSDIGHNLVIGTAGLGSAAGALLDWGFPKIPTGPGFEFFKGKTGTDIREGSKALAAEHQAQLSPAYSKALNTSLFESDDLMASIGAKGVNAIPSLIAAIPASMAGPLGVAAFTGALQAGATADDIRSSFEAIPHDKLVEMSPAYVTLRKNGWSEQEAKTKLADSVTTWQPAVAGIASALASRIGIEGILANKLATGIAVRAGLGRVGTGAAAAGGEAIEEMIDQATQNYGKQQAMIKAGTRKEFDYDEFFKETAESGIIGAVVGAPGGAILGGEHAPKKPPGTDQTATPGGAEQSETHGPAQGPPAGGPGQASPGDTSAKPAQPPPDAPAQAAAADSVEPTPAKQPPPDTLAPAKVTVTEAGAVPAAESEALQAATGTGGASTAAPPPAQGAVPLAEGDLAEEVTTQSPGYYANTDPAEAAAIGALAANRPPPATAPTPPPAPLTPAAPEAAQAAPVPPASQPAAPAPPTAPVAPPPAATPSAPPAAAVSPAPPPTAAAPPPPPLTPQAPPQPAQATVAPEPAPVAAAPAPAPTVAAPEAALPPQPVSGAEEAQVAPAGPPMAAVSPQGVVQATPEWQEMPKGAIVPGGAQVSADPDTGRQYIRQPPSQAEQAPFDLGQWQAQQPTPAPEAPAAKAKKTSAKRGAKAAPAETVSAAEKPAAAAKAAQTSREREQVSVAEKPAPAAKQEPAPAVAPQAKAEPAPAAAPSPAKVEATPPAPSPSTFESLPTPHKMAATKLSSRMEPEFHDAAIRKEAAARAVRDLAGNENLPPGSLKRLFQQHYADIEEAQATQARAEAARPRVEAVAKEKAVKAEERAAEVKAEPRKKVRGKTRAETPEAIRDEGLDTTVERAKAEIAEKGEQASPAAKRVMEGVEKQASRKRGDIVTGASYKREGREMYAKQAEEAAKKNAPPTVEQQLALEGEGAEKVREAIQKRKVEAARKKTAENEAKAKDVLEKAELPSADEMSGLKPGEWIKEVQDAVKFIKQQVKEQGVEVPERHQTLRGPYTNLLTLVQNASADGKILGPNPDLEALVDVATAYNDVVHEGKHEEFSEEIRSRAEDLGGGATSYDENGIATGDEDTAPTQDKPLDEILRFQQHKPPKHTPTESGQSYTSSSGVQTYPENTKVKAIPGKNEADRTIYNVQSGVSITSKKVLRAADMLRAEKANFRGGAITPVSKAIWKRLDEILAKALPNFEIHIVSNEDVERLFGRKPGQGKTGGVYSLNDAKLMSQGKQGVLIINEQFWNGPQQMQRGEWVTPGQVLRHELVHALSEMVIQDATHPFRNALYHLVHETQLTYIQSLGMDPHSLDDHMIEAMTADIYGFSHPAEFLSEAYSNPQFQTLLAELPVTEHMEEAIASIPQGSAWDKFIRIVTQMLGIMGFGKQGMSSLEAVIRLGERTLLTSQETAQYAADFLSQKRRTQDGSIPQPGMVTATDLAEFLRQDKAPDVDIFGSPPRAWQDNTAARFQQWFDKPVGRAADTAITGAAETGRTGRIASDQSDAILRSVRDKGLLDVDPNDGLTSLDRLYQAVEHAEYLSKAERADGQKVLKDFRNSWEKWTPQQRKDFIDTSIDSSRADIHPDDAIGQGKNGHVSTTDVKDAGKREVHKDVSATYASFTPEMKAQFKTVGDYFTTMQNKRSQAIGKALIDNWMEDPTHNLPAGWTADSAAQWVADGNLAKPVAQQSQAEKDLVTALGKFGKTVKEAAGLTKIKGYYTPLSRRGDWVLSGWEEFDTPTNGQLLTQKQGENRVGFNTAQEAEAFLKQNPYATYDEQTWAQDPATGKWQRVRKGTTGGQVFHIVKVNNEYVSFHDNKRDARRERQRLLTDPARRFKHHTLSQVEPRRTLLYGQHEMGPNVVQSMHASIDKLDLPDGLKELLKGQAEQAATRLMKGNRVKQRDLPRRNISGYSNDYAHNIADYVDSAAKGLAVTKQAPVIRKHERALDKEREDKRYDDNAEARGRAIDEIKKRIQSFQAGEHRTGKANNLWQRFVFANYLGSLRYSLTNMIQLPTWGWSKLIGDHGEKNATIGMMRGFKAVGYWKSLGKGIVRKDALEDLIARVGQSGLPRAQEHVDLLNHVKERNRLDMDTAGMEIEAEARRTDTGIKSWEIAKAATRGLENMLRALPRAVELVNRAPLLIASYEAAREAGKNPAQARVIALDTVNESQFNYDPLNQPRYTNKPSLNWAMKFKKFAFGAYSSMVHQIARAGGMFSKDQNTRIAGRRAARGFMYLMLMHWAVSGLGAGLPLEPIAIVLWLMSAAGLWDTRDWEMRNVRKWLAANWVGEKTARFITDGPLRTLGRMDLSSSINLSQLLFFKMPKSGDKKDLYEWIAGQGLLGAPGEMIFNSFDAFRDMKNGDMLKGLEKLVPLKGVKDALKAWRLAQEGGQTKAGVPYSSPTDTGMAILQGLTGVKPARQTEQEEEVFGKKGEEARLKEARNKAIADIAEARMGKDPEAKRAAREAQREWNKTHKGDEKITEETIIRSVERRKQNRKKANKELENM